MTSALGQPLKEADQIVQTPEVAILTVALSPRQPVTECLVVRQGHCLAEVNHPDLGQASVVMHKEKGTAHYLQQSERKAVRERSKHWLTYFQVSSRQGGKTAETRNEATQVQILTLVLGQIFYPLCDSASTYTN